MKKERELFGMIAQRKKYVTAEGVEKALTLQAQRDSRGEPHKLLGILMLELEMLSSSQLLDILQEMQRKEIKENDSFRTF
jgi:hypothetical protein